MAKRKEATKKQKDYAASIATVLNIKLPEENTSAAYRDFIEKNQERFSQSRVRAVHYTDEQIARANAVDILEYARSQGLELKKDGKDYRVKNYSGGFIITPEKNNWNWFDGNIGGGVVRLCMFLENKTWQEAVGTLLNEDMEPIRHRPDWKPVEETPKEFHLPEKNDTNKHVYAYLTKTRGIDAGIVKDMLDQGYIYENQKRSCVFVGRDREGVPRHASVRSTNTIGDAYKKDVSGSQKKFSFSVHGTSGVLNVFEAPIDALSHMSLQKLRGKPINDSYVALGGVTDKALEQYLEDHKDIRQITVCTDGDEAGEKAAERIQEKYGTDFEIVRERSLHKDFNEDLVVIMQEENFKRNLHEVVAGKSKASDSILIGKTPNILVACGAVEGVDFTISKTVIDKCTRPEIRDADGKLTGKTGHGLTEEQLYSALMNVKEPVMVLKGNRENSLVVVTEYPDDKNRPIVVSVVLDKKSGRTMINNVSSVYGRDKFEEYLGRQIQADNILAFDNKKAEPLLQPIGKWYPKRGEVFSYDATIAYSMESVKKQKNDKIVLASEEGKKGDERLENQFNRDIDEIKRDGMALQYVQEQSPEICLEAVKQNGRALQYVKEQTPEICMEAVKQNGWALEYVEEQTLEICMEAVKQNGQALLYVKEQTPEICLEAVRQNGYALQDVKEQTPEICLEAVKQNEWALTYVEEQTPEICMEAVKQDVGVLSYVKEQTSEIYFEVVKQDGQALRYVEEQTPEICLEAVKQNGLALEYVKERTPEICMAAVHQNRDAWHFVDKQIEQIMKKLDAFAKIADDYEIFADEDFQEELYRTLQEYKKLLQDNLDGIATLQAKFYEQSNPNELDINHPDLWNRFWNYLERYGVTGDVMFSNRLNNIAARTETKEQAFSIMKDIKEYLNNRLYMTSYMRGDVAVNEDIASYYLENAYRYLNQEFDIPDRNQEKENQIKAVQKVFSLDEAATGRFYTTNLGGTRRGMGENPYFYITEDLQSSFEAAYASYMASDEDGRVIGYSNAGMSTAQLVELAKCGYDSTGREVHILNQHLENQVFDEDSKVLADIEKRLYKELKQRNAEAMAVQTEDFNSEVSNLMPAASQSERIQAAIESTADYVDPGIGFTAVATGDMPAGTKYRIVTYGENGKLVPYQENPTIYSDRTEVEAYLEEHKDRLESIDYDDIMYQAGKKIADYNLKQKQRVEEGLHSFQFDEDGYLHFSITINDYDYDGLYRIYAPADGPNRRIVSINNGQGEPFFKENWELIRRHLEQYVNEHPEIGPDGEEIPREKASVYCEWSEHDAFEEGKVYSVFEFDRLMEQADTEWIELRQQEREQYGEDAYKELYKRNLPQHQTYAKTKYTVFVPGMTELTLRQDIGDGFGGMIDFVRTTRHKHYAVPLENAFLDGLQQELDNHSEMRYEEANTLLKTLEQNEKMNVINDTDQTYENGKEGLSGESRSIEKGSEIVSELPEKTFAQQVDEVLAGNSSRYSDLKVCDTPDILLKAGCEPLPMFYTKKHLRDALRPKGNKGAAVHHHGLDVEQIKAVPELLRNPVMIYDSLSRNDSIVVVTSEVDADNSPIVVIVRPNGEARYEMELVSSNFVLSVHGRDNFSRQLTNAIEQNKVLYCDKQKSQELFSVLGLQLPQGFNNFDFDKIIHQSENIVKAAKQAGPSNEDKDLAERLPEYPARPEKKAYHNDEEWRQAVETYKRGNQRFNKAIEQLAKEYTQNKSRFNSNEEFVQWLSQNGYTEGMIKGIDLKAASDFVTAYEQVSKVIPEIKGNLFSSISLEKPSKKNAVAWVSGDKALHLSDRLFKPGVYSEVIKSELFHTAQGYYSKAADPFLHVYIHEMGHSVESTIAEKIGGKEKLWSELGNLFNVKVDIGEDLPYISGYGNENYSDWFAEMFSAYVNGNMEENVLKFGEFIQGCLKGELGHAINKHKMNVINDTDQTRGRSIQQGGETLRSVEIEEQGTDGNSLDNDTVELYQSFSDNHKQFISERKVNRIPIVINAFGGPGSGKSVSCMDICQQLKKQGYNAEYVQEYAKELVYDKNLEMLDGTPEHQFEVLKEQLNRVDRLYGSVDFIVTDSPVLLNGVYNKELTPEYDSMVTALYNDFENFTYFVERDASAYQQEGRIQNLEESQKIDKDIKQLLKDKNIYYGTYNHDTIDKIVSNSIRTFNRVNHIEEAATQKQIAYAQKIAGALKIDLPEDKTKAAYKSFISEHQEAFSQNSNPVMEKETGAYQYKDYLEMVTKDGSKLKDVPKENYTDELLLAAVSNWGAAIQFIPEEKITKEIVMASVQQYGLNLKHVPAGLRSEEICIAAYISSSGKSIRFTPGNIKAQVKEQGQKQLAEGNNINPNAKRQVEVDQLQKQGQEWVSQIENMLNEHETDPEAMIEDIAFAGKFYRYSTRNIQLMLKQNPGITYVASASAFEKMGYHVKENETPMLGRVPVYAKYITNEKDERVYSWNYTPEIKKKLKEGTLAEDQAVRKFRFVAAFFDISQTDCPAEDYPSIFHMGVPSELHQEVFDAMKEFAESLGFKVMVTDLKSISLRGSCEPDKKIIRINDKLESTMALSTLCHEIAHGIIHTSENSAKMSTAQKECEADVMDVMLESSLGLPINESRRDHLFNSFNVYKKEQATKEHPYEVTLEKLIDRVQKDVFRPYAEDINFYLDRHLPAEGIQNEKAAEEVIKNIALLDSVYETNHRDYIDEKNELFDAGRMENYQELYQQTREEYRLNNSFVPKLAVFKSGGGIYNLCDVQFLDETTADLLKAYPGAITAEILPGNVEVGNILSLKENVLEHSRLYLVTGRGLEDITETLQEKFAAAFMENKINCGLDAVTEYQCIYNILQNGIKLEPAMMKQYDHLCETFGFSKNVATDSSMQLMAHINLVTEGLSQNNRELVAEYVFRTGNFKKAENYAERLEKEPGITKKLLQEMKLVDSYKYMLWTIAEYENSNAVSEKNRITTGAYNSSAIPVLNENVHSLSQINESFRLIRKHASSESVKYYTIAKDEEVYRIAYVELNEYQPETVYSVVDFADYEEAKEFYDQYLEASNSKLVDETQVKELAVLQDKENQVALSDITTIGKTIASQKYQHKEPDMSEEEALELLRLDIRNEYPDIRPAEPAEIPPEIKVLKDFKARVSSYGEERFIELCNLKDFTDTEVMEESIHLAGWLTEQKTMLDNIDITGMDDVKQCVNAALECSVTAADIEQAFNAIDSAVLSSEYINLEAEFEGFEEYNNVLDTLKASHVTPDKFCYVNYDAASDPFLYTSDRAGNIYRKSLRNEWNGSVRELYTGLKENGYEICTSFDDFKAYAANNRLGLMNVPEKEKNEAYVRILESTSDMLPKDRVLSIYDFKNTMDKLYSGSTDFHEGITYKLVTRKDQEIHSYIDAYSGSSEQNVFEQLYGKVQEKVPELSKVISKQYYQDQINFNENHRLRPLMVQLKKQQKPIEDSEELNALMNSNDKLKEKIKKLDLSPADAELLKLNVGNIQTEQIANIARQQQMDQQMKQQKVKNQQQMEISI